MNVYLQQKLQTFSTLLHLFLRLCMLRRNEFLRNRYVTLFAVHFVRHSEHNTASNCAVACVICIGQSHYAPDINENIRFNARFRF